MAIGTMDPHKALTETEYGDAIRAHWMKKLDSVGGVDWKEANRFFFDWIGNSGVRPFIEQVARAKGLDIVLCTSTPHVDQEDFFARRKISLTRRYALDNQDRNYLYIDSRVDITLEVMSLFWADLKSRM